MTATQEKDHTKNTESPTTSLDVTKAKSHAPHEYT